MKFELMELPFERDAMAPFLSRQTIDIHYEKHHAGYMRKLEESLEGNLRDKSLEEILLTTDGGVFKLAAQTWNHNFYWQSLAVSSQQPEEALLLNMLNEAFGGVDRFTEQFAEAAANEFGSGWAWLLFDPSARELSVTSTTDAENPMTSGMIPLLTLDVWEHAYYLDYQNRRADYISGFLEEHVNWRFVESNLKAATLTKGISPSIPAAVSS